MSVKTFKEGIRLDPQSADPTATEGQVQFSDGTARAKGLWQYKDGAWTPIGGGAGDADTLYLIKAAGDSDTDFTIKSIDDVLPDFDGSDTLTATFDVPTSGSNALLSEDDDHKVYRIATTTASRYDAVGRSFGIPRYARGRDVLLEFQYRTQNDAGTGTAVSVDGDYMVWIVDDTNMVNTTTTSTGSISAGTAITVGSTTGMAVGDKIWVGETGGTTQVTEAHVTEVTSGTQLKISETVNLSSGDRFVTGVLSDVLTTINAADDDTNKKGSSFKKYVLIPDDCADIKVIWQQLTSETDSFLYFDNILLSADPFKKVETQRQPESFAIDVATTDFWDSTGSIYTFDTSLLSLDTSRYLKYDDTTQTRIVAKEKIVLDISISGYVTAGDNVELYDYNGVRLAVDSENATGYPSTATASIVLEKDQYVYGRGSNASHRLGGISMTATPIKGTSIIVESADSVMSDWTSFTPTGSWTSNTTYSGKWRRVGDSMEIIALVSTTGAPTASALHLNLPSGYTVDSNKIEGNAEFDNPGSALMRDFGTGLFEGSVGYDSSNSRITVYVDQTGAGAGLTNVTNAIPFTWANGDSVQVKITLPIQGWSATNKPLLAIPTITVGQNAENAWTNGLGVYSSGNAAVPYFPSNVLNTISNLGTFDANDTTNGAIFTATARCKVIMKVALCFTTAPSYFGISKNATAAELDASISSIADGKQVAFVEAGTANNPTTYATFSGILEAGDTLAPHTESGTLTTTSGAHRMSMSLLVEPEIGQVDMAAIISAPSCYVSERQASGTSGQTSLSAGSYVTNVLNTLKGDIAEVGVTLASNQFTLPAEKYDIEFSIPLRTNDSTGIAYTGKGKLYNVTDSVDVDFTGNYNCRNSGTTSGHMDYTELEGGVILTITKDTTFEIKTRLNSATSISVGQDAGFGDENKFTDVKITRKR